MKTELLAGTTPGAIEAACALLARGELVAFPTETVYGLGADATADAAVERIYAAKGRPSHNPLIAHVASLEAAEALAFFEPRAQKLAERFWPGPLTLVLKTRGVISPRATAGGNTVALRIPAHPIASALLARFGAPIAAPSANRSNGVSPTTAAHVAQDLSGKIPLILDGGPAAVGLESTVLDLSERDPILLRPGSIDRTLLEATLGARCTEQRSAPEQLRSPGQLAKHYAPSTPLAIGGPIPRGAVLLVFAPLAEGSLGRQMPEDPSAYAQLLYATLRWADRLGAPAIWLEPPPRAAGWTAIWDRLERAGTK